jgi:hypothetical protein
MSPVRRRHVGIVRAVATNCGAAGMARHPAATDEDLDGRGTDADIGSLTDKLVWNAVVVAVDLEVVVDADFRSLPGGELIGPDGQRPESRPINGLEDTRSGAFELSEGPVVEPGEAVGVKNSDSRRSAS